MLERYRRIQEERAALGDEGGFTLIELLIVIVVLGILAAIVIFALGSVSGTSAQASCNTDAKSVETAGAAFQAGNPGTLMTASTTVSGVTTDSQLVPSYLRTWPNSNSSHYSITLSVTGTSASTQTFSVNVTPNGGSSQAYDSQAAAVSATPTSLATGCFAVN